MIVMKKKKSLLVFGVDFLSTEQHVYVRNL